MVPAFSLSRPVFRQLALYGRACRFLLLSQCGERPAVGRVLALAHDAFEPELTGMEKHGRAIFLDVLIELNARRRARDQLRQS